MAGRNSKTNKQQHKTEGELRQFYAERTKKSLATRALNKERAAAGTKSEVLAITGETYEYRKGGLA